jgi:hypothetical protein
MRSMEDREFLWGVKLSTKIGQVGVWGRVAWDGEGEVKKWEKEKQIG